MLETLTNDEIAERLIRDDYRWASNTITVNISALNYGGQIFANEAMAMWSDATGLNFVTTNSFFADLTFEHGTQSNTAVAGWSYTTSPGDSTSYVTDATITISEDWIEDDWSFAEGADLYSFSFKTFIHEIGHTIGMLHPGDYDGAGVTYANSAEFANDSYQATTMSYFDQVENPNVFASYAVPITPMVSDILAMQSYYGSGSSVRTSNTNYGYNSNAGGIWDDFVNATESIALTIWDDGGIDTLDFSGTSLSQQINLIEESFSDILGLTGNLTIMRGTEIENAKGGGGADTLIGNALDNGLEGGGGNDALLDTLGDDTLMGGDGQDRLVSLAGTNTLSGEDGSDYLTGGAFNDTLNGNSGNDVLRGDPSFDGLGGSDVLTGGTGNDVLMGGRSADTFVFAPNEGADRIGHFDDSAVIYSAANGYQVTSLTQDFETGLDVIELQSFAGINASNVFDFISDVSGNAVFSAQGTSITLVGVTEADLGADNFIFV